MYKMKAKHESKILTQPPTQVILSQNYLCGSLDLLELSVKFFKCGLAINMYLGHLKSSDSFDINPNVKLRILCSSLKTIEQSFSFNLST